MSFLRMKLNLREASKSAFFIGRPSVGSKMMKNDVFEVRYLENENGDRSSLLHFVIDTGIQRICANLFQIRTINWSKLDK